ncbi:MAG: hypothetical protein ACREL7_08425 [Longimicrobiales bacterium]
MTVHHYAADGSYVGSIGRRGKGPGEFVAQPGVLVVDADSLLFVKDGALVEIFEYPSGRFRQQAALGGFSVPGQALDGRLFFGRVDRDRRTTVGALQITADSPALGGPFPSPLGRSVVLDHMFSYVQVTTLGTDDTVAVAVQGSDYLFVGAFDEPSYDSIHVPVIQRHGARPDLLERITDDPRTAEPALYQVSVPWALAQLPNGYVAYVAADQELSNNRLLASLYVSVVDTQRRSTCPDAAIPAPRDPQPWVAFRGDTLFIVVQDLSTEGRPYAAIRKYLMDTERCEWIVSENGQGS